MKTADELKELKQEVETLNKKLHELTEEELEQVFGGTDIDTAKIDEECMHKCLKSFKDLYKCMKQCAID